jgi:hypothetical protein
MIYWFVSYQRTKNILIATKNIFQLEYFQKCSKFLPNYYTFSNQKCVWILFICQKRQRLVCLLPYCRPIFCRRKNVTETKNLTSKKMELTLKVRLHLRQKQCDFGVQHNEKNICKSLLCDQYKRQSSWSIVPLKWCLHCGKNCFNFGGFKDTKYFFKFKTHQLSEIFAIRKLANEPRFEFVCKQLNHSWMCLLNGTAHFKNVDNHLNTNIFSFLETFGGQSANLFLNVVPFFNTRVN